MSSQPQFPLVMGATVIIVAHRDATRTSTGRVTELYQTGRGVYAVVATRGKQITFGVRPSGRWENTQWYLRQPPTAERWCESWGEIGRRAAADLEKQAARRRQLAEDAAQRAHVQQLADVVQAQTQDAPYAQAHAVAWALCHGDRVEVAHVLHRLGRTPDDVRIGRWSTCDGSDSTHGDWISYLQWRIQHADLAAASEAAYPALRQ